MKKAKEIVVVSGKGGTGKTTITASLAAIMGDKVIADADVDAANLYILLHPENVGGTEFTGKSQAEIDPGVCVHCGLCKELCRFFAVGIVDGDYKIDPFSCDGCGLCKIACPVDAIEMREQVVGQWFSAGTEFGDFIYARLNPGAENSGSLIAMVKEQAKRTAEAQKVRTILIDGPPGIGCPVISALSGADFALIVTEPTYSGIGDLRRVFDLTAHFGIKSGIVINRSDVNPVNRKAIEAFAREKNIPVLAEIPHSPCIMDEITESRLPARKCPELARQVENIYKHIKTRLLNE